MVIEVSEASGASAVRRAAAALCSQLGFDATAKGRTAIIVTEMATNLLKHAGSGEVVLTGIGGLGKTRLQVLSLDKGPGFDAARCIPDGYSTAGSPGTGLGAIRRLASTFDVYTRPGASAVVFAEVIVDRQAANPPSIRVAALAVPKPGEEDCGDGWAVSTRGQVVSLVLVDGLGHGPDAAIAARTALAHFGRSEGRAPGDLMVTMHAALRPTRGATVAVVEVDLASRQVRFAGVGNASAVILGGGQARHLVSHNGTVGHELRKVQEFMHTWPPHGRLVLTSDGIATRWELGAYPGLLRHHPALLAGLLYRDFRRVRDDASVVVLAPGPEDQEQGREA